MVQAATGTGGDLAAQPEDLLLAIGDGTIHIAGQSWRPAGNAEPRARILAVHGTLDNCGSFASLAPRLAAAGFCIFAMDLSGHGHSDRRPGGFYHRTGWVLEILQTLAALGGEWDKREQPLLLMGHSLGAGLCSVTAGSFPELFSGAILIDGLGWWAPRTPQQMAEMAKAGGYASRGNENASPDFYEDFNCTRRHVEAVLTYDARANGPKEYESFEAAVNARVKSTQSSPVGQFITLPAARAIVRRGIRPLPSGGVAYSHDPRLQSAVRSAAMKDEDALGYLQRIPRILLLHGDKDHTWPGIHERTDLRLPHLDPAKVEVRRYPGEGHHLHADSPERLLPAILDFLGRICSGSRDGHRFPLRGEGDGGRSPDGESSKHPVPIADSRL